MLGVSGRPVSLDGKTIEPLARFGVKLMSIGFLLEDPKAAVIWRGPMLHGALQQFMKDVDLGRARLPRHGPAARAPATSRSRSRRR